MKALHFCLAPLLLIAATPALVAQEPPREAPDNPFLSAPLADGPWELQSKAGPLHVEVLSRELVRPWAMAWLPDGAMLITERPGRLRVIRNGELQPTPISGLPPMYTVGLGGLMDIALHPAFIENQLIYLSYSKIDPADPMNSTLAVLRARWDGGEALADVEEIFEAKAWFGSKPAPAKCCGQGPAFGSYGGRIVFGPDGKLYITSGDRNHGEAVQDQTNHFGKLLRLNDDGSVPEDNPFVGQEGWDPAIWSTGHRNPTGLTVHPETGELWSSEFGPMGGDEINHIHRAANYGWMDVTQGQHYDGTPARGVKDVPGMTDPVLVWGPPSVNPGNIAFYDGEAFPAWQGDLLVARMDKSLQRVHFDAEGNPAGEEALLTELKQRLRDVRIGPDGLIYLLTDSDKGALLRLSPGQ